MPGLYPSAKAFLRDYYRRRLHNVAVHVKKRIGETTANANPIFAASKTQTYREYSDFYCSFYHGLSGKLNRLFEERGGPALLAELGILTKDTYAVSYVPDLTLTLGPIGQAQPAVTNNLIVDEEVKLNGVWYKVRVVVHDSEGVQHTVFVTQ